MLYEYQLAHASVPHYPWFRFINLLGRNLSVCFCLHAKVSYRHVVLLMILKFSVFSPSWLVSSLSNCRSLFETLSSPCTFIFHAIYLSPSAHHHLLPFIIFYYIHFQVCVQKCPCCHPPLPPFPTSLSLV